MQAATSHDPSKAWALPHHCSGGGHVRQEAMAESICSLLGVRPRFHWEARAFGCMSFMGS